IYFNFNYFNFNFNFLFLFFFILQQGGVPPPVQPSVISQKIATILGEEDPTVHGIDGGLDSSQGHVADNTKTILLMKIHLAWVLKKCKKRKADDSDDVINMQKELLVLEKKRVKLELEKNKLSLEIEVLALKKQKLTK
ncbi:uncharacterized protein LOC121379475, partial [Gigantopelta aegis]|uniref:uncharacterized protein LOC121379475 n=1 Tax=Gigantopelta aegis TaxID=1735272 RepID=UPI001B887CAE